MVNGRAERAGQRKGLVQLDVAVTVLYLGDGLLPEPDVPEVAYRLGQIRLRQAVELTPRPDVLREPGRGRVCFTVAHACLLYPAPLYPHTGYGCTR